MALELDNRNMMVIRFLLFCKWEKIFETIFLIVMTRNQVHRAVLYWLDSNLWLKDLWKAWSKAAFLWSNWGFIKTTDHQQTGHRPTNPPTTYLPAHWPIFIDLGWNRNPGSEHVLYSIIAENFKSCTV